MFVLFENSLSGNLPFGGGLIRETRTKKLFTVLFYNSKKYWDLNNRRTVTCTMVHPTDGWSHLPGVYQNLSIKACIQSH